MNLLYRHLFVTSSILCDFKSYYLYFKDVLQGNFQLKIQKIYISGMLVMDGVMFSSE